MVLDPFTLLFPMQCKKQRFVREISNFYKSLFDEKDINTSVINVLKGT